MTFASARAWLAGVSMLMAAASPAPAQRADVLRAGVATMRGTDLLASPAPASVGRLDAGETSRISIAERGSAARIAGQIVGGALAAGLVGFIAWNLLDDPEGPDRRVKGDAGYTPNANTAYAAGSFVGSVLAVYLIGRGDGSQGSLAATALGAGVATIPLVLGRHEPYLPIIGIALGAPAQAAAATLGYQLTRRER